MSNVVSLFKKECECKNRIWCCDCGCVTNYAHENGDIECVNCGTIHVGATGGWREKLPDLKENENKELPQYTVIVDLSDPELNLKRTIKRMNAEDCQAVIVLDKDGGVHTWGFIYDSRKHRGWFNRRIATAKVLLLRAAK